MMKSSKEMAEIWNVSERTVTTFCKSGKVPGAIKEGRTWKIPEDAKKPADGRVMSGRYVKKNIKNTIKALPIGISDYVRAQSEYYYVDKTMMIKEFLDQKPLVTLFTRPRRFGKTLNMDMLRVFFEISDEDTSKYFSDKEIWKCGDTYRMHQGKYPVIFLTFKDVKFVPGMLHLIKSAVFFRQSMEDIRNCWKANVLQHMKKNILQEY